MENEQVESVQVETTPEQVAKESAVAGVLNQASAVIGRRVRVEYDANIVQFSLSDGRVDNYVVVTDDGGQLIVKDEHVHFYPVDDEAEG